MMKKNITVVTVLLFVLLGALLLRGKLGEASSHDKNNQPEIEEPANNEQDPKEGGETSVEPEKEPVVPENPEDPDDSEKEPKPEDPIEIPEHGIIIQEPEKLDVLVNKKRSLPDTYVPEDLVTLSEVPTVLQNPEVNQLRKVAYEALKELFQAAIDEEGYELHARSGYRSYNTQASLYSSYVDSYGQSAADKYSAKPGQSEHQTGLSIDITCQAMNYRLDDTFFDTDEGKWVAENAHRFGYIIRYPKGMEDITGYMYEPWHIRYLGRELAAEVYNSGLTLEEYCEKP